jgi:Fur family peroxide stress response transcriptional regulator
METKNKVESLVNKNVKPTLQRQIIYETLSKLRIHPTAEELYQAIKNDYPAISLATIYNTLDLFEKNKIIITINRNGESTRYDLMEKKHFHLFDEEKNEIVDYYDDELYKLIGTYLKSHMLENYQIQDFNLEIFVNKIKE